MYLKYIHVIVPKNTLGKIVYAGMLVTQTSEDT